MTDKELNELVGAAFPNGDLSYEGKYWNDMSVMLDQKSGKRGGFYWWIGGVILALISTVGFYLYPSTQAQYAERKSIPEQISPLLISSSLPLIKEQPDQLEQLSRTNKNPESNSTNQSKLAVVEQNGEIEPKSNENMKVSDQDDEEVEYADNPVVGQSSKMDVGAELAPVIYSNTNISNSTDVLKEANSSNPTSFHATTTEPFSIGNQKVNLMTSREATFPLSWFDQVSIDSGYLDNSAPETEFSDESTTSQKLKWFTELNSGFAQFNTKSNEVYGNTKEFTNVQANNSNQWYLSGAVGVQYNRFYIATGIQYREHIQSTGIETRTSEILEERQISERKEDVISRTFVRHVITKIPDGANFRFVNTGTIYDYDTTEVTYYDTTLLQSEYHVTSNANTKYKLKYFYIPLTIGYEYTIRKNWLVEGFAGAEFGLLTNRSGVQYDPETNSVIEIENMDNVASNTFSYQLGIGVGYYLSPSLTLRLRPNWSHQLRGPFTDSDEKPNGIGGSIVLRYKLK